MVGGRRNNGISEGVCVCRNCSEISAMSSVWVCLGNFYMGKRNKVKYPQHSIVIAQRVASIYKDQEWQESKSFDSDKHIGSLA